MLFQYLHNLVLSLIDYTINTLSELNLALLVFSFK